MLAHTKSAVSVDLDHACQGQPQVSRGSLPPEDISHARDTFDSPMRDRRDARARSRHLGSRLWLKYLRPNSLR